MRALAQIWPLASLTALSLAACTGTIAEPSGGRPVGDAGNSPAAGSPWGSPAGSGTGSASSEQGGSAAMGSTSGAGGGASRGGAGGVGSALDCTVRRVGAAPLRRLNREQYDQVVRDLLGIEGNPSLQIAPDEKVAAFYSNAVAPVDGLVVEQYAESAERLAAAAVAKLESLVSCDRQASGDAACALRFIEGFGARAYRRPLSASEVERYRTLFQAYATPFQRGIQRIIAAMLQSPHFLYHLEQPNEAAPAAEPRLLGGYALASRLSFALWGSMPDAELFDAAASGALDTEQGVRRAAERLLTHPRAEQAIGSFHLQWLGLDGVTELRKDATLFPGFDAAFGAAMRRETVRFADHVVRKGDGRLETLLTAPFSFPEGPLLALYGVAAPADTTLPVALPPAQRAGLLTQAAFLARHAHANQTSPVHRGVLIRRNVLCTALPDAPANVNNTPPEPAADATTRERFAEHTADTTCAGCHSLIDPIGFSFEKYDALGRFREQENAIPVDASGHLSADGSERVVDGAVELAHALAQSQQVRRCVARQWFRFSLGHFEAEADQCTLERLDRAFAASDYNLRELILTLVTSDAFRYRAGEIQ